MPVPWEVFIPFGVITAMYGVTGLGITWCKRLEAPEWKPFRGQLDAWDYSMMERDRRLTGSFRGQRDDPNPPPSFATNKVFSQFKLGTHAT